MIQICFNVDVFNSLFFDLFCDEYFFINLYCYEFFYIDLFVKRLQKDRLYRKLLYWYI